MKNFKILMPVLAFVMAIGMAFTKKADVQSNGWVERNGMPYQLQNDPCVNLSQINCRVIFSDDPNTIHQVFTSSDLQVLKKNGSTTPYILNE